MSRRSILLAATVGIALATSTAIEASAHGGGIQSAVKSGTIVVGEPGSPALRLPPPNGWFWGSLPKPPGPLAPKSPLPTPPGPPNPGVFYPGLSNGHDNDHWWWWKHHDDWTWWHGHPGYYGTEYGMPVAAGPVSGPSISGPSATTPTASAPSAPCNCLTKRYLNDGSVLFTDLCTKEQAIATSQQGPQPQTQ